MHAPHYESFNKHVEKANQWLAELESDLDWSGYRHRTYVALRAVLQALRDRLTTEETAHLGAQLPMILRGTYYENWKPSARHKEERHLDAFLIRVGDELGDSYMGELEPVVRGVFRLLDHRVSDGEIEDIQALLPHELKELWPSYVKV